MTKLVITPAMANSKLQLQYPEVKYEWPQKVPPGAWDEHGYPDVVLKRVKRQHYDPDMLEFLLARSGGPDMPFLFEDEDTPGSATFHTGQGSIGKIEMTGYVPTRNPMTEELWRAQAIVLTTTDGIIIPMKRLARGFVLTQNYMFKSFVPKGVKVK